MTGLGGKNKNHVVEKTVKAHRTSARPELADTGTLISDIKEKHFMKSEHNE